MENPSNKDLKILFEDTVRGEVESIETDLVVLCAAMKPREDNVKLAEVLGVELDEYGFFKIKDPLANPIETNIPGIYVCGPCHGPRDIPESVAEASAAASKVAEDALIAFKGGIN